MIPAVLICGYLGAGKTTLVNRLLNRRSDRRLVVLVNDFGGINIDKDLIVDADEAVISLENGCACCTIQNSLGDSLDAAQAMRPDAIVLEASGVALPQKIAAFVDGWPGIRLAGSITLADCLNLEALLTDKFVAPLVRDQIRGSSRIVLTKEDLASDRGLEAVSDCIASLNPGAAVSIGSSSLVVDELIEGIEAGADVPAHVVSHLAFDTATFTATGTFEREGLTMALENLPKDVWRVKGFVYLDESKGSARRHSVQRVGNRTSIEPERERAPSPISENSVVFIAPKGLIDLAKCVAIFAELISRR